MKDFYYCCPQCKEKLLRQEDKHFCSKCNKHYPINNGIPDFREKDFYWGVVKQERIRKILDEAKEKGWQQALEESLTEDKPDLYRYLVDVTRSYWHLLIPLPKESKVLDLGCGWGGISIPLAAEYENIISLDATQEKVHFVNLRSQQSKIDNINAVCGDALNLPFDDNYFDLVVVYGVMEWMGLSAEKERPEFYQLKLLKEINRVLKKGGYLYLVIENRWAAIHFLGHPDPHTNLRFITLMPRFLADIYSHITRKQSYRVYTHSLNVYKKMFRQAGFSEINSYSPLPSYRKFWYLLSLDDEKVIPFFLNDLSAAATPLASFLLNVARHSRLYKLIKHVVSDYSFVLKK